MKSCNCYALRAIDCTCLPKKYDEIYTTPDQEPVAWMEMVVANLVREGVNKHKARELAQHFYTHPPQRTEPICPACKAEVLYECVACSSNNYPPKENT